MNTKIKLPKQTTKKTPPPHFHPPPSFPPATRQPAVGQKDVRPNLYHHLATTGVRLKLKSHLTTRGVRQSAFCISSRQVVGRVIWSARHDHWRKSFQNERRHFFCRPIRIIMPALSNWWPFAWRYGITCRVECHPMGDRRLMGKYVALVAIGEKSNIGSIGKYWLLPWR